MILSRELIWTYRWYFPDNYWLSLTLFEQIIKKALIIFWVDPLMDLQT